MLVTHPDAGSTSSAITLSPLGIDRVGRTEQSRLCH
jgi:hypothetical protein